MKSEDDPGKETKAYEAPNVLATYEKEELEDVIGIDTEVEGGYETPGGGCGCGGGSILNN
jgi:hypothetical protein